MDACINLMFLSDGINPSARSSISHIQLGTYLSVTICSLCSAMAALGGPPPRSTFKKETDATLGYGCLQNLTQYSSETKCCLDILQWLSTELVKHKGSPLYLCRILLWAIFLDPQEALPTQSFLLLHLFNRCQAYISVWRSVLLAFPCFLALFSSTGTNP